MGSPPHSPLVSFPSQLALESSLSCPPYLTWINIGCAENILDNLVTMHIGPCTPSHMQNAYICTLKDSSLHNLMRSLNGSW